MKFNVFPLRNSAILYLYALKDSIQIDPDYQRMGEVWSLDKKQLLIDSIINDFDIPKIYFHDLRDLNSRSKYDFAIIDGRQRLEAVWGFIDGEFLLSEDIEYLRDKNIKIAGMTYSELSNKHPQIKQVLDASSLTVFVVQTDDIDLIEEMFSRLNEAVPLNAAEKRNAFGGPLPQIVRELANAPFFKKNLKISNKRYQHRDLAAKMLYLTNIGGVADTKKVYLDAFFKKNKNKKASAFSGDARAVKAVLRLMSEQFTAGDKLLRSSGMVMLYFLLFQRFILDKWKSGPSRSRLVDFDLIRANNRKIAEEDITVADYDLLEFDRLMQTPNDAYAIKFRLELLEKFVRPGGRGKKGSFRK